jgi:hypothetical protein
VENAVLASLGDDAKGEMPPLGQKSVDAISSADPARSELMTRHDLSCGPGTI